MFILISAGRQFPWMVNAYYILYVLHRRKSSTTVTEIGAKLQNVPRSCTGEIYEGSTIVTLEIEAEDGFYITREM